MKEKGSRILGLLFVSPNEKKGTEDSVLWTKSFIPVYFVVALLGFLLFNKYLQANILLTLLLILPVTGIGIASIIYNLKKWKSVQLPCSGAPRGSSLMKSTSKVEQVLLRTKPKMTSKAYLLLLLRIEILRKNQLF